MQRSTDRILTTHVGSLIRPRALIEKLQQHRAAGGPADELDALRRESIAEIVRQQASVGIDVVSDGEFGKESWATYIIARLEGFEVRRDQLRKVEWIGSDIERFADYVQQTFPQVIRGFPTEACIGPVRYRDTALIRRACEEFNAALAPVRGVEGFMTAVAPASTAFDGVDEFYGNEREYVFAVAEALRTEYLAIHEAGLILQVDDAVLANLYDHLMRRSPGAYRQWAELRVEALNHALRGIPEDRIRYHVCFGSWHLPHLSDAPLEEIVDLILQVKSGAYAIEAANPRHEHEWRVWQTHRLPNDRILIPGVVTHHTVTVEHPRVVADRLVRFAGIVGRENVIAGTDCGFAQLEHVQRCHPTIMWAKLEALVEGARLASRELWGRED